MGDRGGVAVRAALCVTVGALVLALAGPELVYQAVLSEVPELPAPPSTPLDPRVAQVLWIAEEPGCTPALTMTHPHTYAFVGPRMHEHPGLGSANEVAKDLLRGVGADRAGMLRWHLRGAAVAIWLSRRWSADELLRYRAEHGDFSGAGGLDAGARRIFGRPAAELPLEQLATLVGLAPAPSRYDPLRHPDAARARRERVLGRLAACGVISDVEREELSARDLGATGG